MKEKTKMTKADKEELEKIIRSQDEEINTLKSRNHQVRMHLLSIHKVLIAYSKDLEGWK